MTEITICALPAIPTDPTDRHARSRALRGSWLCGACLGATTRSLHPKLCHVLGGTFDLPHAPTHAVVLPHVAAFNLPAAPSAHATLCRALGTADPARALADLGTTVGAPRSLAELGLRETDLREVINQVLAQPGPHWGHTPATVERVRSSSGGAVTVLAHGGVPVIRLSDGRATTRSNRSVLVDHNDRFSAATAS